MSEKNTNVTETVEIDQAMGVMPEEVDPGMSVMPGPGVADTPTVIPELDSMLAVVLDQLPAYTTTDWKNKPSTATPVTAEIMKKIEQRLVDLTSVYNNQAAEIKALRDSVSQLPVKKFTTGDAIGAVTLRYKSAVRSTSLIIADGNGGFGSVMMFVDGASKKIVKLSGDCSPSWNESGTELTFNSTNWNGITVICYSDVEFSVAP